MTWFTDEQLAEAIRAAVNVGRDRKDIDECIRAALSALNPYESIHIPTSVNEDKWVIRKGGYFYRPNAQGYTCYLYDAGTWTHAEALKHVNNDPFGPVTIHPYNECSKPEKLCPVDAEIAKRDAIIAQLRAANPYQWKPIETAPKDGTAILRWCPTKDGEATHWLPVPPAPEGDK